MNGLQNIGNTCYLNSAIQLFLNCDNTINRILSIDSKNENYNIIKDFIIQYKNNHNIVLNPKSIKKIIGKINREFYGFNQNDSSEFLIILLNFLNNITNDALYDNFGFDTNINIKCKLKQCLNVNEHIEKELLLFLDVSEDLDTSYRKYKNIEKLDQDNMYSCDKCNRKTIARKKVEIKKWKNDVIIVFKRFNSNFKKINRNINIPLKWRHNLNLKGFIIHMGSFSSGHYVYIGKKNNNWYLFNDSSVSLINDENLFKNYLNQSYILHYEIKY